MPTEQEEFDRSSSSSSSSRGSVPRPDPTVLTTEALLREIGALRTLIGERISATEALFETKIQSGREGGLALRDFLVGEIAALRDFHETDVRGLRELVASMGHLRDEKLVTVQTQFDLIERQRVENKADTKAAVDAALAAAKEAVKEQTTASDRAITKSETATSEQLKQMNVTFTTAVQGISGPISDLKDRVTALESVRIGGKENMATMYVIVGLLITLALVGIGAIGLLMAR
jgi:hypothetical protein